MFKHSPALIVATLALFVALGGSAFAAAQALITSRDIKDGTIRLVDIAPSTKVALRGQQGPEGPAGAAGLSGPAGPAGGFDPRKLTYVYGPMVGVAVGAVVQTSAYCPAGAKVVGGGFFSSITAVAESEASNDGTYWYVQVWNDRSIYTTVRAFAVCSFA